MKKFILAFAVLTMFSCTNSGPAGANQGTTSSGTIGTSSNAMGTSSASLGGGLLKGVWLQSEPEEDMGDISITYFCFSNAGANYWINEDDFVDGTYISLYSGTYSILGSEINMSYTTRVNFEGDAGATPTNASTWTPESMDGDNINMAVTYSVSGTSVVLTYGDSPIALTAMSAGPAYTAGIPCQ